MLSSSENMAGGGARDGSGFRYYLINAVRGKGRNFTNLKPFQDRVVVFWCFWGVLGKTLEERSQEKKK